MGPAPAPGRAAGARTRTPLETRAWLRSIGRAGPESWLWPVAAFGVVVLVWGSLGWFPLGMPHGGHDHGSMAMHHAAGPAGGMASHLILWAAMVTATMLPLVAENLRGVGLRSPRGRRTRATLRVAAGWGSVWLAFGLVVVVLTALADLVVPTAETALVVGAAAIGWQLTDTKRLAVARCHRRFAPPLGAEAGPACVRFGRSLGRDCVLGCWPTMTMMSVAGHQPVAVAALAWLSWRDRRRPHDRPSRLVNALVIAGVAGATVLLSAA